MAGPSFHLILFVASFLLSLASGIENYALIFYVRDLFGADKAAVGLISGVCNLAYLAGILAFLRWKSAHPRKVLWLSSWAMAWSIAIYLAFPSWTVTFVFHAVFGLAMALFWPRIMGWLSWGVEGTELSKTMGRFNFSWSMGSILAPWLGGLLVEQNPLLPFETSVVLLVLLGLLMPLGSRLFPGMRSRQQPVPAQEERGSRVLRYPSRAGIAGAYFLSGCLLFIFPAFAKESLGFSESLIGSFLLVRMVAATLGFSLWGRWTFWHFRFGPLAWGMLAFLCLILFFPLGTEVWHFYVLFAAAGLLFSFVYSYALFHGVSGSENRERSMTLHEAFLNIGLFLGTVLGGYVSQTWSMAWAFVLCAAVLAVLLVVQTLLARSKPV